MEFYEKRDGKFDEIPNPDGDSEIAKFYDGCNILITGSTGFIGHLVLEKVVRCCPGVKKIYLLVRVNKGMSENQRAQEILRSELFDVITKRDSTFSKKIVVIPGDCSKPNLGISDEDRERILDTNIVFHIAAALQFDDHYRRSFNTNVIATRDLLELSKKMKKLKAFMYVSTAYAHVDEKVLKEEFVKSKYSYKEMKMIIDEFTDEQLSGIMPLMTGPNATTYSVMKSITENVVQEYVGELPVGIIRPSIVISTEKEPLESWIKGFQGPTAVFLGVLVGILRVLYIDEKLVADFVPADKVASAVIAATWDCAMIKRPLTSRQPVYNVVSYKRNPLTWKQMTDFYHFSASLNYNLSSERGLWEPFCIMTICPVYYSVLNLFFHIIPAVVLDTLLRLRGKDPLLTKLYRKGVYLMNSVMHVYHSIEWPFDDDNLYSLWEKMSKNDRHKFDFSMDPLNFNWRTYYCNYLRGLKVYVLKEKMDFEPLKRSQHRRKVLRRVHLTLCSFLILVGLWIAKCLLTCIYNRLDTYI